MVIKKFVPRKNKHDLLTKITSYAMKIAKSSLNLGSKFKNI